jgi:C1A family cysteine protease
MKYLFLFAFTIAIASFPLNAKPTLDFPLDKPYPKTHRLSKIKTIEPFWVLPKNSDVDDLIKKQSPIRNQAARGTCSIFSATALLESLLLIEGNTTQIDLAEEFLEYIAARTRTVDGSTSDANIRNFQSYGMPNENTMPYIGQTWKTLGFSSLSQDRCGKVSSYYLDSCLLAHYDPNLLFASENSLKDPKGSLFNPDFLKARQEAEHFRDTELNHSSGPYYYSSISSIKQSLKNGIPVLVDLDFYYGAWGHSGASSLGIKITGKEFSNGWVGYPEYNSVDRNKSHDKAAGHSILIVGYDDDYEISTEANMDDGTTKKFKYKGAFIFKNSWSTYYGRQFTWHGKTYPGYGAITYQYAQEFGGFFGMSL